MDGSGLNNLPPLARTSTINTIASTATGSSSSSTRTVRASRYAIHTASTDPSDFFYHTHHAYPGSFAPTPPVRSSSLRPMPQVPHHPPGVHVQVTHATPTKTGDHTREPEHRSPTTQTAQPVHPSQPPHPSHPPQPPHPSHPPQPPQPPGPSRARSRSIDEVADSDDTRHRTAEEKKLIAREKGKMRQRRKRARDRAAREEAKAEGVVLMPVPKADLTTSTLLTIPHRPSSSYSPLAPAPPPPINTQLYPYSPVMVYTPSVSSDSSPYWSPAAPSGDISAHSSTASLVDPTHLAPSPLAPSHHVPLSTPIVARSQQSSNAAKRRKSEPEPEEFRQIKGKEVGLGLGDDLDDRPHFRRTASDGGANPNLRPAIPHPSSTSLSHAEVFASNIIAAVNLNPQLMELFEQNLGLTREDLEEMKGGLAGVYDQWRVNKGMGSVRLDESLFALPPSSATSRTSGTSASASSVGSPDPMYRRPIPPAFPNSFHDASHQRHVSTSSSADLRSIPPSLSLQDLSGDSAWTGTPLKASGDATHASPSVSVHTPSTGHGSHASMSTGDYSLSDRSERVRPTPFYPMYQNIEVDTAANGSWEEVQGVLESPVVVQREGGQYATFSPSHRVDSAGMYPSAFPSVLQPSPTSPVAGGAAAGQPERPSTGYAIEGYVAGPDGLYYAPNAGDGSVYMYPNYRREG